jgi:hypothetical protein
MVVYIIEGFKTGGILAAKIRIVTGGKDLEISKFGLANSISRMYTLTPNTEHLQFRL